MVNGISTLLFSLEMDWVLVWLTAKLLGHRTTTLRITLAASVGLLPTLWVLLRQNLYAVPWELGLVWPLVMMAVAFKGLARRFWLKGLVLFYAMSLLAGGLMNAGLSWLRLYSPGFPGWVDWALLAPAALIVLGLWMPTRRVRQLVGREAYGEIELELQKRVLRLPVLWDSGNELTDAKTRRPVVIVEMAAALDWIPGDLLPWILAVHRQETDVRPPELWQDRASGVPFHTINGQGVLPAVPVDRARGQYNDRWHAMVPQMVAFAPGRITRDHSYHALATPKSLIHYPNERVGA
ncbi:sigma-E processing peptidase SpoIIGA [Sulfobacillus harzensis]|uniref:Sigma-E processing peptidase SpoIIGA n=1 Tax=Sulfobacillus harzensis TaxID=2729629 RepID=A0A7Y0L1L2_9FIRM|nr:sigma-E processing peptidase SpoIIGA [Sulfobacillus harzensis]